jgi:Asp/Glu/hydantoin racemase
MKILILNPNMSQEMTDLLLATAKTAIPPDVELIAVTAKRGMPYISSRAESVIAGTIVLEMIAEHQHEVDGVVIAAFGDPALLAARELFDLPVVALAEASMLSSCMLGKTFALVTFAASLKSWYEEIVAQAGLTERCAAICVPDAPFSSVCDVQHELEDELVDAACRAVAEHAADVIVLSGAPLSGLAQRIADRVPVPIVDPIIAAVSQIQTLVRLNTRPPRAGRFARPDGKPVTGVSPALAGQIERKG